MINDVLRLIKGESSHWINQNELMVGKFAWQKEYLTISVSESQVDRVRMYIQNQESHHRQKTFTDEYEEFIKKFEFSQSKG